MKREKKRVHFEAEYKDFFFSRGKKKMRIRDTVWRRMHCPSIIARQIRIHERMVSSMGVVRNQQLSRGCTLW